MKSKLLPLIIIPLIALSLTGCVKGKKEKEIMPQEILSNKQAVLIIAKEGFQDREYSETRRVLEEAGVKVTVAAGSSGQAIGKLGARVSVDKTLDEIKVEDYDAIIFIGGPGALSYLTDPRAHNLARETVAQEKVLGAICIAPEILAKAGVLKNKKATVWTSPSYKESIEVLKAGGAEYVDENVVVDGKIVTANGPSAAQEFGQKILELL